MEEEVEKECTRYKVQIQHDSTHLKLQSLDENDVRLLLKPSHIQIIQNYIFIILMIGLSFLNLFYMTAFFTISKMVNTSISG